jgi:hypothetical protein
MAVVDFRVTLPEIDAQVDLAFKNAIKMCLDQTYEAGHVKTLVEAYLMWKYRESWGEMTEDV